MTWIVNVKGDGRSHLEICIVRSENELGRRSYGWYGPDKIPVHPLVHGDDRGRIPADLKRALEGLALRFAKKWNEEGGPKL